MSKEAKISISIFEGKIEFSGSEEFVKDQIQQFKPVIDEILKQRKAIKKSGNSNNSGSPQSIAATFNNPPANPSVPEDLSEVFVIDDEKLRIVKNIPGESIPKKTLNTAILCAFAYKELLGQDTVSIEEVRKVCINHSNYDKKNFSAHVKKGDPKYFLDKGSSKSRTIKLIRAGVKKAQELISEMNNGE